MAATAHTMRRADKSIGRLSILKRSLANAVSLDWKVSVPALVTLTRRLLLLDTLAANEADSRTSRGPARVASRRTALIKFEPIERQADGNLVGIARPDDEIGYFLGRPRRRVGALQPRGVDRALWACRFCHIFDGTPHSRGDITFG